MLPISTVVSFPVHLVRSKVLPGHPATSVDTSPTTSKLHPRPLASLLAANNNTTLLLIQALRLLANPPQIL